MKAVVTIEIEINEDVLEHRNIDKASFVKKHLVLNRCIPDGAYLTHDMERFTSEYGSENLFTNVRILSALPTRMKKNRPGLRYVAGKIDGTIAECAREDGTGRTV